MVRMACGRADSLQRHAWHEGSFGTNWGRGGVPLLLTTVKQRVY